MAFLKSDDGVRRIGATPDREIIVYCTGGVRSAFVVAVLAQESMTPPRFFDTGASFIVTVYGRPLDVFSGEGVYAHLNESQRKILSIIRNRSEVTPRELLELMNDRARRSVQRDIKGLVEANLISANGEGRALRYRLRESSDT